VGSFDFEQFEQLFRQGCPVNDREEPIPETPVMCWKLPKTPVTQTFVFFWKCNSIVLIHLFFQVLLLYWCHAFWQ